MHPMVVPSSVGPVVVLPGATAGAVHYVSTTLFMAALAKPQNYSQGLQDVLQDPRIADEIETLTTESDDFRNPSPSSRTDIPLNEIGQGLVVIGGTIVIVGGSLTCNVTFSCV